MTPTTLPDLGRPLTVTEAALIDAERGMQAMARRRQQINGDPAIPPLEADETRPGVHPYPAAVLDALTRPVRLEISFDDPVKTRRELEVLARAIVEAQAVTWDHPRGISNQRLDARHVIKTASDAIAIMAGKGPRGRTKTTLSR